MTTSRLTARRVETRGTSPEMSLEERSALREAIAAVREEPGRFLSEVEVPSQVFHQGERFARSAPLREQGQPCRFKMDFLYELLLRSASSAPLSDTSRAELEGWQAASKALLRYALNLLLAPQRPEFRRIRVGQELYGCAGMVQIPSPFLPPPSSAPAIMCTRLHTSCSQHSRCWNSWAIMLGERES